MRSLLLATALFAACNGADSGHDHAHDGKGHGHAQPAAPAPAPAPKLDLEKVASEVKAAIDTKADPCTDFYQYACGQWMEDTEIPGDRSRWSRSFSVINDANETYLKAILEEMSTDPGGDAERKKVGDFYQSCMDEEGIEARGTEPLTDALAIVDAVKSSDDVLTAAGKLGLLGLDPFWGTWVDQDHKNPDLMLLQLGQGGISLPDREYYLSDEERFAKVRPGYIAHVETMFGLLGVKTAKKDAKAVFAFEKRLAEISKPRHELRDPEKTYNRLDRKGLKKLTPGLKWKKWFAATGRPDVDGINVATPDFFVELDKIIAETDPAVIRAYLRWHLVHKYAPQLPKAFVDENFAFFAKELSGQKEQAPRWKRCARATDAQLGHPLGKIYVDRHFGGESKPIALQLVKDLESAFEANLPALKWMDDPTRERAKEKLHKITNKIGYPNTWRDYSSVEIGDDYLRNTQTTTKVTIDYYLNKIGKAPNPDEWFMTPPTVNAYYNPGQNEIAFPAGILQAPFFHAEYPAAMNYGAIGMVIGHEITHGFDDGGRKFDGDGRLSEWWEPEVSKRFEKSAECVEKQYNGFEIQPDLYVNGKLTLGENIADLGGIKQAYAAYEEWEKREGKTEELAGYNGKQLLFLSFAQGWCSLITPEQEAIYAKADSHSPPKFRVNGPLRNFDAFGEAFSCEVGSPMRPKTADVCEVW